jgi:hypothetical protein
MVVNKEISADIVITDWEFEAFDGPSKDQAIFRLMIGDGVLKVYWYRCTVYHIAD